MAHPTTTDAPVRAVGRLHARIGPAELAAVVAFAVSLIIYVRTLLPGVSFGDWAESEMVPARLGVLHPTGYPLYTLVVKLFTLIPVGSVAYRANLVSGVAAAGAVGVAALIAIRLGVRPVIAAAAALALAFTGTLWEEATFSEMNGLHLLLAALMLHRAIVWRAERRDRDLLLGSLLGGLCVANHGLAITVVPIVVLFVLVDARREIVARPWLLAKTAGAFVVGLSFYLYLPLRAMFGPADLYGRFLTWNGFFGHVSGAQFRGDMHFTSIDSVRAALVALPHVIAHLVALSNLVFVAAGVVGIGIVLARDRWFGTLLLVLGVINVYFYANYLGDLSHYLLLTWLILATGVAVVGEWIVHAVVGRFPVNAGRLGYTAVALPVVLLAGNWVAHDQSANQDGQRFTAEVFAALPADAVLLTYWDALTPLSYEHCIEGVRPDVSLRAYDEQALVTCDPVPRPLTDVARQRPVFALLVNDRTLAAQTGLVPVQVQSIRLPWGQRYPELDRALWRLYPPGQAP